MKSKNTVQSKAYQLVKPYHFSEVMLEHELRDGWVVVQPTLVSICHADIRYFTGNRRKEALISKLPMALFHEGVGQIVTSKSENLKAGQRIVIVPNIPSRLVNKEEKSDGEGLSRKVSDNYVGGVFLGSGFDGIGQEYLVIPEENALVIPASVPDELAVLSELSSISYNALKKVSALFEGGKVAVFGDGPVGYLTAVVLSQLYSIPKEELIVFGAVTEKLENFDFATTYLVDDFDFDTSLGITTVIECTGGAFSESAINQAVDIIEPEGVIVLLGVSEDRIPINTRDILEKGLTVLGNSRSTSEDFQDLINLLEDKNYQKTIEKLLPDHFDEVSSAQELENVFLDVIHTRHWKKRVIKFNW